MLRLPALAAVLTLLVGAASAAQTGAPAAKAAPVKAAPAPKAAPVAHSAASIDCSKQADAKGLHGKAREKFRSSCKAAAKKG